MKWIYAITGVAGFLKLLLLPLLDGHSAELETLDRAVVPGLS